MEINDHSIPVRFQWQIIMRFFGRLSIRFGSMGGWASSSYSPPSICRTAAAAAEASAIYVPIVFAPSASSLSTVSIVPCNSDPPLPPVMVMYYYYILILYSYSSHPRTTLSTVLLSYAVCLSLWDYQFSGRAAAEAVEAVLNGDLWYITVSLLYVCLL